jgi:peptidyl-prolyl cis-trans isomerase C/foldase protein PrsA
MKNLKIASLIIVSLVAILNAASCSRGPVVAIVDGFRIRADDLADAMNLEKEKYDPVLLKTPANARSFKQAVLENLIQEAILLNAAKEARIHVSSEELQRAIQETSDSAMFKEGPVSKDVWKEKQRRRLVISKLVKQEVTDKIPVTPEETRTYYNAHKQDFYQPTQYHARQIIVDNKEIAGQIAARLKKGEDFAALAQEYSLSPDRKRGGDLGFFNASTFPPIFTEICEKLKIGEISDVVATDYGFQIFQLLEKRQPRQQTLDDVKNAIESLLREKYMEKAFDDWFKKQRGKARITVYEKALEGINV